MCLPEKVLYGIFFAPVHPIEHLCSIFAKILAAVAPAARPFHLLIICTVIDRVGLREANSYVR
jgi:hypothetical protein